MDCCDVVTATLCAADDTAAPVDGLTTTACPVVATVSGFILSLASAAANCRLPRDFSMVASAKWPIMLMPAGPLLRGLDRTPLLRRTSGGTGPMEEGPFGPTVGLPGGCCCPEDVVVMGALSAPEFGPSGC